MIDKVEQFVLSLKGYPHKGHAEYWAVDKDCFAWVINGKLSLSTEPWLSTIDLQIVEDRYALLKNGHITLGTKLNYLELMEKVSDEYVGKYDDPKFTTYKCWD